MEVARSQESTTWVYTWLDYVSSSQKCDIPTWFRILMPWNFVVLVLLASLFGMPNHLSAKR